MSRVCNDEMLTDTDAVRLGFAASVLEAACKLEIRCVLTARRINTNRAKSKTRQNVIDAMLRTCRRCFLALVGITHGAIHLTT